MTTDELDHPRYLSSHGEFLGVSRSNFFIFWYMWCTPTREERGAIAALYLVTIYIYILGPVDKSIYMLLY